MRVLSASVFLFLNGGVSAISKLQHELNEEIRDKEIRLIGETGEQMGIVSAEEALHIADERGLDLVKISPQAVPPVCKLMNYGKYKFEQSKREKEARKNQHVVEIKEIRMSPGIDVGDFNTKLKNAQKFLADGTYGYRPGSAEQVCRAVCRNSDIGKGSQDGGAEHVHFPLSQSRQVISLFRRGRRTYGRSIYHA